MLTERINLRMCKYEVVKLLFPSFRTFQDLLGGRPLPRIYTLEDDDICCATLLMVEPLSDPFSATLVQVSLYNREEIFCNRCLGGKRSL